MAVTAGTLIGEIRFEVKDPGGPTPVYPDPELWVYLSDAQEDIVSRVAMVHPRFWLRTSYTQMAQQNITNTVALYNLPADLFQIVLVTAEDNTGAVTDVDPLDIERTLAAAAEGYFLANDQLVLFPTPSVTVANGLKIYHIPRPARIAANTTPVLLADEFRGWLKEYVVLKCKARQEERASDFAPFFMRFESYLNSLLVQTNVGKDAGWVVPRRWYI